MAITTKELAWIVDTAKVEALCRKKTELFRTITRDERVDELLNEARRVDVEHLEQMRELVREG